MSKIVKVGVVKAGCIGTLPLIEFLLDERAERKDIEVRVVGSGANMSAEKCVVVAKEMVEFNPDFAVFISPNAAISGPTKGRTTLSEANIPTVVLSDGPTKKITQELEGEGFGFIIIDSDAMIGARREFLDPAEMALFNSDVMRVLAVTGVFNIVFNALDKLISEVKDGKKPDLPKIIVNKESATEAAEFQNPYAKSKAMAAYEISRRVANLSTQGCFKVKDWKSYISIVSAAHEMMRQAAKLADEARELEKSSDALIRTPHHSDGTILKKKKLIEKPKQ